MALACVAVPCGIKCFCPAFTPSLVWSENPKRKKQFFYRHTKKTNSFRVCFLKLQNQNLFRCFLLRVGCDSVFDYADELHSFLAAVEIGDLLFGKFDEAV